MRQLTDIFESTLLQKFQDFQVPLVVLERVDFVLGRFNEIRKHAIGEDIAVMATARRPWDLMTSRHDFASTVVSVRLAYMFEETITVGMLLSGFNSVKATTDPTSMGNPCS